MRAARRGRKRQHHVAEKDVPVVLADVGRRADGREVRDLPVVRLADVDALDGVHPVPGACLGLYVKRAHKMLLGQGHRWDPVGRCVRHDPAARVGDQAAHCRQELTDVLVGRCARHDHAVGLVAVFIDHRRERQDLHLLFADRRGDAERGVIHLGRGHAHAQGRVGQVVAQTERSVRGVGGRARARVEYLFSTNHGADVRDPGRKFLRVPGQTHVEVSDAG